MGRVVAESDSRPSFDSMINVRFREKLSSGAEPFHRNPLYWGTGQYIL